MKYIAKIINNKFALLKGNVPTMPAGRQEGQRVLPAFTLIEILVVVGILTVLIVSVGGIMGTTFRAKNTSEGNELLSSKAVYILDQLKKDILSANPREFTCTADVGSTKISFKTKDNMTTTLTCLDEGEMITSEIASETYRYLEGDFLVWCNGFVTCRKDETNKVTKVEFKLNIGITANVAGAGSTGVYFGVAVPRE